MKKEKSIKLCVVDGCNIRHELNSWRCEKHSVQYYGGSMLSGYAEVHRKPKYSLEDADNG